MTHIITIETQSETQFAQIKGLAQQLGVRIKESHVDSELSEGEALQLLDNVAGGWEGDVSIDPRAPVSQKETFKKMEKLRLGLQHIKVDPDIDLSALANEVNNTPL